MQLQSYIKEKLYTMKKILSFILVLLPLVAMAQITHTDKGSYDANAQKILQKAASKFKNDAVSMKVTVANKSKEKSESAPQSAKVVFQQGKYRVTLADQELYCDGTAVWHWNSKANEVVVNKMSDADVDLMNPALLLTTYHKNFKPKYIRQENDGTAVIDLTPLKRKSYYKIRLLINATSGQPKQLEIHNYDGSNSTYKVSDFKTLGKQEASYFTFNKEAHKGVEVIDMR